MKIIEMTKGKKLKYELSDGICSFEYGAVTIDLNRERGSSEKIIDISLDNCGNLIRGVGDWYAAQLTVPAKTYTIMENGLADEMGFRQITKTENHLNTDEVTLALWGMEG